MFTVLLFDNELDKSHRLHYISRNRLLHAHRTLRNISQTYVNNHETIDNGLNSRNQTPPPVIVKPTAKLLPGKARLLKHKVTHDTDKHIDNGTHLLSDRLNTLIHWNNPLPLHGNQMVVKRFRLACKDDMKLSDTPLPLTALASPWRSGNTWVRHLLQEATGKYFQTRNDHKAYILIGHVYHFIRIHGGT